MSALLLCVCRTRGQTDALLTMKNSEFGALSGAAAEDTSIFATTEYPGHRKTVSIDEIARTTAGHQRVASGVTLDGDIISTRSDAESAQTNKTGKITKNDVKNIFRGSTTTGTVSHEQIARIRKMHDKISDGVDFNFNYCCLLMVASIVAGLGLASDSATTVISSMLLSPIMGPVIGMAYGLIIWDMPLIKRSARNEICSIIICLLYGLVVGFFTSWTKMAEDWPTKEMLNRGTKETFLVGIPIAFFSGIGVALSVLDDSTSSLVGVAISASLLPPAVNCGLLWIFAAVESAEWEEIKNESGADFFQMGGISLALTCCNVVVVWLGAALMFRAKEVLPVKKRIFWDDLKIARRIYQKRAVLDGTDATISAADIIPERRADDPVQRAVDDMNAYLVKKKRSKSQDDEEEVVDLEAGVTRSSTHSK